MKIKRGNKLYKYMKFLQKILDTNYDTQTGGVIHKKVKHLLLDIFVIGAVLFGIISSFYVASAATFTWVQNDWSGGISTATSTDPTNRTGWTKYSATSSTSVLASASGVSLAATSKSITKLNGGTLLVPLATPTVSGGSGGIAVSNVGVSSVYAVSNTLLYMFSRDTSTGALTALATPTIGIGNSSEAIDISPDGKHVYVAAYSSGYINMFSRDTSTGALTALPTPTITSATPRGIVVSPDGKHVYTTNSVNGTVSMYSRNTTTGALTALATPTIAAGTYPFGLAISPDGSSVYAANNTSGTVSMYSRNTTTGALTALATPTIAVGGNANQVTVSPDSNYVYVSNNVNNTIAMFSRDTSTGALTALATPTINGVGLVSGLKISPDGTSMYVTTNTNGILMYERNISTGLLTAFTPATISAGTGPYRVAISPDGAFVYVANNTSNNVSMYRRGGFEAGTNSSTVVTGSGIGASVALIPNSLATGGATTTSGAYMIHTFTSTSTTSSFIPSQTISNLDYLIVGGGGAGGGASAGTYSSAGGGGGGMATGTISSLSSGTYTITVGAGGLGVVNGSGNRGATSSISGPSTLIEAPGGGGGGGTNMAGGNGASGGGSSGTNATYGVAYTLTPMQGRNGGAGNSTTCSNGGGGGGAGGVGAAGACLVWVNTTTGGYGGPGLSSSISGSAMFYSAGGGGMSSSSGYSGGSSIGGGRNGVQATNYTGAGGGGLGGASAIAGGYGGSGIVIVRYPSYTSGVFSSAVINLGGKSGFSGKNLNFTSVTTGAQSSCASGTGVGCAIRIQIATSTSVSGPWNYFGTDGTSGSYFTASGDAIPSAANGAQYIRYQAYLHSDSPTVTPTLNDITINYAQYVASGDLTSSVYDSGSASNLINDIWWTATGVDGVYPVADEGVGFQIRSSPDGATWSNWCGSADTGSTCTGTNYFTASGGTGGLPTTHPLRSGGNDRYFQYKAFLTSGGDITPTITNVTVQYVVNANPVFDTSYGTGGVSVAEATTTQANTGKVVFSYSVKDPDTTSGTVINGYIKPSFKYSLDGTTNWTAIDPTKITYSPTVTNTTGGTQASCGSNCFGTYQGNVTNAVDNSISRTYTMFWDAKGQLGSAIDVPSAKIALTIDDLEAANNQAVATSTSFILDTTPPLVSFKLDDSDDEITFNATDTQQIYSYNISNNSDFSTPTSGSPVGNVISLVDFPWTTFVYGTNSIVAYSRVQDIFGNNSTTTSAAPYFISAGSMSITDLSNSKTNQYREFLAWPLFTEDTGVSFSGGAGGKYELWRSTDGITYTLQTTITNSTTNYYTDSSVVKGTTYYYKMRMVDSNGDISNWSNIVNDVADGQGGTDTIPPTISNVQATSSNNTQETITFDTDELSSSGVVYGKDTNYGSSVPNQSYVKSGVNGHSVTIGTITALEPNTTYHYKVSATDVMGNTGTSGDYTFTTLGGPIVSNVSSDTTDPSGTVALVTWNTNTLSNSIVKYGQDSTLAVYAQATGIDTSTTSHSVLITGLNTNTKYFFSVSSSDAQNNITVSDNLGGNKYSFQTGSDANPPIISSATSSVVAPTFAIITWVTDKVADSEVRYGTTPGVYTKTYTKGTPTILHSLLLSEDTLSSGGSSNALATSTQYYYVVKSTSANNLSTTTNELTFKTPNDSTAALQGQIADLQAQAAAGSGSLLKQIGSLSSLLSGSGNGNGNGNSNDFLDKTKPIISDIKVDKITSYGAEISFTTSKDTRGLVEYGTDSKYGVNTGDKIFTKTHTIVLKGLILGTEYHFAVDVIDNSGNITNSEDQTFKTTFIAEDLGALASLGNTFNSVQDKLESLITSALPSLNPPFISKPEIINAEQTTAEVDFTTNVKAYGSVQYATEEEWSKEQKYTGEMADTDNKVTDHKFNLTNLKAGSKYHYSVHSYVFNQALAKTDDATFLTKAGDVEARISERKKDSFRVVWTTDKPTSSIVEYKKSGGTSAERKTDLTLNTYHDVLVDKVTPNTTYLVKAYGDDANENRISAKTELTVTTSQDVTPPTISNFKIESTLVPGRADKIQTLISWKTDEPATTAVYYGEGSGSSKDVLPNKQEDTSTLTTNHTMIITNLKPGAIYRLQVASKDDAENEAKTPMRTIITPKQSESIVDVIFSNFDSTFQFMNNIKR